MVSEFFQVGTRGWRSMVPHRKRRAIFSRPAWPC